MNNYCTRIIRFNSIILSFVLIGIATIILFTPQNTNAGCYICAKVDSSYVKSEHWGLDNDFYIYYLVPKGTAFKLYGYTKRAKDTLAKSQITRKNYNSKYDKIELIAGARARAFGWRYNGRSSGLNDFIKEICCRYYYIYCYTG